MFDITEGIKNWTSLVRLHGIQRRQSALSDASRETAGGYLYVCGRAIDVWLGRGLAVLCRVHI